MEQGEPTAPVRVKLSLAMALLSSQSRNVGVSWKDVLSWPREGGGSTTDGNSFDGSEHSGGGMHGTVVKR